MRIAFLDPLEQRLSEFPSRYLGGHEALLAPEAGTLPAGVEDAEAVVWWSYPVDKGLIDGLPRLKFMQRVGLVRTRGDASAALVRGVPVSVIPLGLSDRVALHALALTLAVARKIVQGHRAVLDGTNPDNLPEELAGAAVRTVNWARLPNVDTINDKTVGIVGFGEIGACFARMVRPFNCRVLYYKRGRLTPALERFLDVEYADLDDLLGRSDIVASFLPYSESTIKLLGKKELDLMKPEAIFVNAGRGPTVDEDALIQVLTEKRIGGAGLDVFTVEPLPISSPLTKLDNVVLAPHSAGGIQGWMNTFERIAENLRRVEVGETVMFPMAASDPQPGAT